MKRTSRWAAAAFVSVAPLAGLTYAYPDWPADAGVDVWNAPAMRAEIDEHQRRRESLDEDVKATLERISRKSDIARELIDNRMSLAQAARESRAINSSNPAFLASMRLRYPDGREDELHARNLLLIANGLLDDRRDRDAVLARLRAELELLRRDGGGSVVLSD